MAKKYRLGFTRRMANIFVLALLRAGVKLGTISLLTVRGRKSGQFYTIPVTLVERDNQRWLVAPYGAVNWVLNARAAGLVTLTRGRRSEIVDLVELDAAEAAPILKQYLSDLPIKRPVQPFFAARPQSPLTAFEAEAARHPVFHILARNE